MQEPDIILLEGTKQHTITFPYDSYLESMYATIKFDSITDTCQRGYIATWEVRDYTLHLNGLDAVFDSEPITDSKEATWYSGFIRVPITMLSQEKPTEILLLIGGGHVLGYFLGVYEDEQRGIEELNFSDKNDLKEILTVTQTL